MGMYQLFLLNFVLCSCSRSVTGTLLMTISDTLTQKEGLIPRHTPLECFATLQTVKGFLGRSLQGDGPRIQDFLTEMMVSFLSGRSSCLCAFRLSNEQ